MTLNWECYNCKYVIEPKLGKNRKKIWRCQMYPDGVPEQAYVPDGISRSSIYNPYLNDTCKFFVQKEKTKLEKEKEKYNLRDAKKFTNFLLNENKKEIPRKYDFSAPESLLFENILKRLDLNEIEKKIRRFGIFNIINDFYDEIISNFSEDDNRIFHKIIFDPNPQSISNMLTKEDYIERLLKNRKDFYETKHLGCLYFDVGEIKNILCNIYLRNKYLNISPPNTEKICKICGNTFCSGDIETYFAITNIDNSIVQESLFPNFKDINDIDICYLHYELTYPESYYDKTNVKSKDEMIEDIIKLNSLLGYLPPTQFRTNAFIRNLNHERNRVLEIIDHINTMYPYSKTQFVVVNKSYKEIFGDWISVLQECQLIDDGIIRHSYGSTCKAIDGHVCKSMAEKIIDDFFYENNIPHEKEPHYPPDEEFNPYELLRADWLIDNTLYIEYFGLFNKEEYQDRMDRKYKLIKKLNLEFFALFPGDEYQLNKKFSEILKLN